MKKLINSLSSSTSLELCDIKKLIDYLDVIICLTNKNFNLFKILFRSKNNLDVHAFNQLCREYLPILNLNFIELGNTICSIIDELKKEITYDNVEFNKISLFGDLGLNSLESDKILEILKTNMDNFTEPCGIGKILKHQFYNSGDNLKVLFSELEKKNLDSEVLFDKLRGSISVLRGSTFKYHLETNNPLYDTVKIKLFFIELEKRMKNNSQLLSNNNNLGALKQIGVFVSSFSIISNLFSILSPQKKLKNIITSDDDLLISTPFLLEIGEKKFFKKRALLNSIKRVNSNKLPDNFL